MSNCPNIYAFTDAKGIVVVGDIHGYFEKLVQKCCCQYGMTDTLIIVAGDCGFGFERSDYYTTIYNKCRAQLAEFNNWVVFIRGNHDNPAYFDGRQVNEERWKAVPDYSVLKACGHTILCIGGATSVDRTLRLREQLGSTVIVGEEKFHPCCYWSEEAPVYNEARLQAISNTHAIDTVITHTAPTFCEKLTREGIQGWLMKDKSLLDDLQQERKVIDDIYNTLKGHNHPLRYWFYGHFHESWQAEIDGVQFYMLDCMEMRQIADALGEDLVKI